MTDGIDGRYGLSVVSMTGHAGIGMLMALQHQVNTVFLYQVVEHPTLNQVILSTDREQGVMQHDNLPTGRAGTQLLFEPVALCLQVEELTVGVEQEELHRAVANGIDHVVVDLGVKEIRKDEGEAAFQLHDDPFR